MLKPRPRSARKHECTSYTLATLGALSVLSCRQGPAESHAPRSLVRSADAMPTASSSADLDADGPPVKNFVCALCGKQHAYGELGSAWPDAAFALTLSEEEKSAIRNSNDDNEDVANVKGTHFVRATLPIPVHGWPGPYRAGVWIRLAAQDFADFERHHREDYGSYSGIIANQSNMFGPTLGVPVTMKFTRRGFRPTLIVTDTASKLAQAQQTGVDASVVIEWLSEASHPDLPAPKGAPFVATLAGEGYEIVSASEAHRPKAALPRQPSTGDFVKVAVRFMASDEKGNATALLAGWWVELDDVTRSDLWSGTLSNNPKVPSTLSRGSRMWIRRDDAVDFKPASAKPPEP
jgi:hypothetical protein